MKITKDMLNEGLRDAYWPSKAVGFMLSHAWTVKLINRVGARTKGADIDGLHCEETYVPSRSGGPDIRVRIYKPLDSTQMLPGMLYLHGGGYMLGTPESFADVIKKFIAAKPCVILAPDYRKAMDAPYPAAFNDCYDTLLWMNEHAEKLGIIPDSFIVAGHSAGGGLTAAVTLKATDTHDVNIAFQMPVYPMIDDRGATASSLSNAPVWNSKSNKLGWRLYLRDLLKDGVEIPAYAAPARATDYSRLPPTITFVGDLEPFRDETIAYVENIKKAGIPVEFELYEGCFHGFDGVVPQAEISIKAWDFLLSKYNAFVDKYVYA